jgi:hypothetical protein
MLGRGLSSLSTWAGVLWVGSLGLLATTVDAADFNFWVDPDSVTECGQAQFMWHGGTAPYELTIYVRCVLRMSWGGGELDLTQPPVRTRLRPEAQHHACRGSKGRGPPQVVGCGLDV